MSEQTPGPWKVEKSAGGHAYVYPKASLQPLFHYKTSIPWPNKTADLQLIAAAPELLAVLQSADAFAPPKEREAWMVRVREVIAKAEGRYP